MGSDTATLPEYCGGPYGKSAFGSLSITIAPFGADAAIGTIAAS
ncbi:hypothetical protein [Steroidobacter denitrificans]|nr:hypothetical protein [Steroidobacter denitrificans]